MRRWYFLLLLFLGSPLNAVVIDQLQSPRTSATFLPELNSFALESVDRHATYWLGDTIATRALTTFFWDFPFTMFSNTFNHEYFGHGSRAREFGYQDITVVVHPFFPYNALGQYRAYIDFNFGDKSPTAIESLAMSVAGVEANIYMANTMADRAYTTKSATYTQCLMMFSAYVEPIGYTLSGLGNAGDPGNYVNQLNDLYSPSAPRFTYLDLQRAEIISILSPTFLWSSYCFVDYLVTGRRSFEIPTFGPWEWMVDARSHWSPFGLGYELRGNFLREHQIYGMTNATDFAPYWTLGYRHLTWVPTGISNLSWTWSGEIWQQPSLRNPIDQQSQIGGSFQLAGKWTFQDTPIAILGNLGYKTEGFSPTQPFYSDRLLGLGATWAL